jgi:hypothetical protein
MSTAGSIELKKEKRILLNVYAGQNTRRHVVLIEIYLNAYNKYLSQTAEVI